MTDFVDLFLDSDAKVNTSDNCRWTPLHFAARDASLKIAKQLIDRGAHIDALENIGNTPLMKAVYGSGSEKEDLKMVKLLLSYGADPYIENSVGVSPFSLAESIGDDMLIALLRSSKRTKNASEE